MTPNVDNPCAELERRKMEAEIDKLHAETKHQTLLNRSYWWRAAFAGVVAAISIAFMFHSFFKISLEAQEAQIEIVESKTKVLAEAKLALENEKAKLSEETARLRQDRDAATQSLKEERDKLAKALLDADQAAVLSGELASTKRKLSEAERNAAQTNGAQPTAELANTIDALEKRLADLDADRKRLTRIAEQAKATCSVGLTAATGRPFAQTPSWDQVLATLFEAYQPYEDFSDDPGNASRALDRLKISLLPNEKALARITSSYAPPVVFTSQRILAVNGSTPQTMTYDDLTTSAIEVPNDSTIKIQSRSINLAGTRFNAPATRLLLMQLRALRGQCVSVQG